MGKQKNVIFILGKYDLQSGLSVEAFNIVKDDKENLIFSTGNLSKSDLALKLVSGNNEIVYTCKKIKVNASIYNLTNVNSTLSLHADNRQILMLIEKIQPKEIGLFHSYKRDLVSIRQKIKRNFNISTICASDDNFEKDMFC
ncbi:MAG: MBL fold metallo-hydrolase RNA specificity domain-containing protein [Candidatus Heimdallarchaeaceae archaeon]